LRSLIDWNHEKLSITEQCDLVGLPRSSLYYEPRPETAQNLRFMRLIDEQYLRRPFFGSRQMTQWFQRQGHVINRKRVRRLMGLMGLESIAPRPGTTVPGVGRAVYPYLLKNLEITRPNQVWGADITYVPLAHGFLYLMAILDWHSRYVVSWRLSNSLDESFCLEALEEALASAQPEIVNTDQGTQFTGQAWTSRLEKAGVRISMDGKGRALDNVFVERLWRSVKYEEIYLKAYEVPADCRNGLEEYFPFYNWERPHQSLAGRTPWEAYHGRPAGLHKGSSSQVRGRRPTRQSGAAGRVESAPAGPRSATGPGRFAPDSLRSTRPSRSAGASASRRVTWACKSLS
jgi:putative transposase